jgi:hypothetical protein
VGEPPPPPTHTHIVASYRKYNSIITSEYPIYVFLFQLDYTDPAHLNMTELVSRKACCWRISGTRAVYFLQAANSSRVGTRKVVRLP